jgi:hypothetical protein
MNINRNNYQDFFLLYLDRELSQEDKRSVEIFLGENTDLQKEFGLLQQTVLTPADMIFENKELLFRKEEKRRVLPLFWLRMAAAVAVLILGSWFVISTIIKNHTNEMGSKEPVAVSKTSSVNQSVSSAIQQTTGNPGLHKYQPEKIRFENKIPGKDSNKNRILKSGENEILASGDSYAEKQNQQVPAINSIPEDEALVVKKSNTDLSVQQAEKQTGLDPGKKLAMPVGGSLVLTKENRDPAQHPVYKEPDYQTDNAISVIALNDHNKGISKFFKKLTKRAPADDNARKVRVSVFQFSY